eukprot:Em0001g1304a
MDYDPSGPFITSMLELKLDATTQFEWQKHSQSEAKVPHYQDLLDFIDLRAQASEGSAIIAVKKPYHNFTSEKKFTTPGKPLTSFTSHHAAILSQKDWHHSYSGSKGHMRSTHISCSFDSSWKHLTNLVLADPNFGQPGKIDLLLGADLFADVLRQGRRSGPAGSPVAFETEFGWVLSGRTESIASTGVVAALHTIVGFKDDILRKFWEIEEGPTSNAAFSLEERSVLSHFKDNHFRTEEGFMVSLPKRLDAKQIGESRTQAVRRFFSLERSLNAKEFKYYYQDQSSFDASAKSSSGVSLNDILLVGPTVHSTLMDVLLRFRMHRIAITADINKMYRAVQLVQSDRDFHRFVWRSSQSETLKDYRMTRVTFGVSASSFAANMCVKQNAMDFATKYPLAAKAVEESFYVDDCLTGADNVEMAIKLQQELQCLLSHGGFLLRKWNSSNLAVLQNIDPDIRDSEAIHHIHDGRESTKTLGLEWNTKSDEFCLTVNNVLPPNPCRVTKRALVSDIAKTFDVLDSVFDRVGLDYAGPFLVKYGSVRKPTIVKSYLCVVVSLSVKAVHLELVSDLTSEAFIAALRRFTARRGYPSLVWSDHGTNFVGANRELKEFNQFLQKQITQCSISEFCSTKNIIWKFIPEHSPHFGGLWESTVKSVKIHLKKIVGTNVSVDDVVVVREDGMVPTLWPLARVVRVYPGKDGLVRVVDVKTSKGIYKRPVTKLVVLLPSTVQAEF